MSKKNDGGPAFPMPSGAEPRVNGTTHYNEGMTLRNYFAAKALEGLLAAGKDHAFDYTGDTTLAAQCFGIADAMIAEGAKEAQ